MQLFMFASVMTQYTTLGLCYMISNIEHQVTAPPQKKKKFNIVQNYTTIYPEPLNSQPPGYICIQNILKNISLSEAQLTH